MKISAAPIIHARTKHIDYRANLLVVPEYFSNEDTVWCRTFITESTRYFELADQNGRKVLFCNSKFVVIGLSIFIKDLYRLCGKEPKYHLLDNTRTNYAFIGFVFPREEITQPFSISYAMYLQQFEEYMNIRWEDSGNLPQSLTASKVLSVAMDFPEATSISNVLAQPFTYEKQIFASNSVSSDEIIAEILSSLHCGWMPAFCSDLPNATSFLDSHFHIGISPHYAKIQEKLLQRQTAIGNNLNSFNRSNAPNRQQPPKRGVADNVTHRQSGIHSPKSQNSSSDTLSALKKEVQLFGSAVKSMFSENKQENSHRKKTSHSSTKTFKK